MSDTLQYPFSYSTSRVLSMIAINAAIPAIAIEMYAKYPYAFSHSHRKKISAFAECCMIDIVYTIQPNYFPNFGGTFHDLT